MAHKMKKKKRQKRSGTIEGTLDSFGKDSVSSGASKALSNFLPPEAKAQHAKGEREFKKTFG